MRDPKIDRRPIGMEGTSRALLLVETADFAAVRRAIGLAQSDLLASHLSERIAAMLPEAIVLAGARGTAEVRLNVVNAADLDTVVAGLHRCLNAPFTIDARSHALGVRIGAAIGSGGNVDDLALIEAAETALGRAQAGGDCGTATAATSRGEEALGRELRRAVASDELFLQYQPKLHLRRQEIISVEALVRWRHPERGLVLPADFIPAAERSDAIGAMTLWTLRQAIADQRVMRRAGHDVPVFVNISGVLLSNSAFVDAAAELVQTSGARLGFEITETSVIQKPEAAIAGLHRLAGIGVQIAIDDYGAGLSSLAYLKQLPARELKIDKLFVTQLSSSHRDPLIVRSTIDLAHALEMEVVAEGVETPTSLALLSVMGCDMVQGFLISRPLVLDALVTFLRDESYRTVLDRSRSPLQRLTAVRKRA